MTAGVEGEEITNGSNTNWRAACLDGQRLVNWRQLIDLFTRNIPSKA